MLAASYNHMVELKQMRDYMPSVKLQLPADCDKNVLFVLSSVAKTFYLVLKRQQEI